MEQLEVFNKVSNAIVTVRENAGLKPLDIRLESSLINDLGFTSLMFAHLTIVIEDAFQFEEFPVQEWFAEQLELVDENFLVESLVDKCQSLSSYKAL